MTKQFQHLMNTLGKTIAALSLLVCSAVSHAQRSAKSDRFLLIRSDLTQEIIQVGSLDQQKLHYLDAGRGWRSIALDDCLALLRPGTNAMYASDGWVQLADGQILPGVALSNTNPNRDALAWDHLWIGRMELPLSAVAFVTYMSDVQPPPAEAGDVVLLSNGDQLSGIIIALGDPVILDVETNNSSSEIEIPVDRVAAVSLVNKPRPGKGPRIWFIDGTIINVKRLLIGDDSYVRIAANPAGNTLLQAECQLSEVMAIFFRNGSLVPLATLDAASLEGPIDRFTIAAPKKLQADALGNLSPIEYLGPMTARYMLPKGVRRFAATAELPIDSRTWGDYELTINCDGREVFRKHFNAANPTAQINTELDGREFTLTLTPGSRGPIQDRLILKQAMFLIENN